MSFELPALPFDKKALVPHISEETIEFHYGRHHQTYVNNLNQLIIGTDFAQKTLVDIVKSATGTIFNNAAQVWNHSFYWECLQDSSKDKTLSGELTAAINASFGGFEKFKEAFTKAALGLFGSGWVWLVKDATGLVIVTTSNAANPITTGQIPLLTCDVWEHAYYIDYRNARAKYLEAFWQIVNWKFVSGNFGRN
ncbi:MAG: Superoxide dismutase [uncultured bacterium]|nr:MAG: Superoxide dismutase [uncultured bacterium]OGT08797.1 MAG: superoxide dismutase [Gammaproteobacteria bacterium RBG_16_37_9]HBS52333.1 superoxide dismutase [Fe] [Coxiellaceae bacterium]HBY55304.1 superoxide dismutase [Fe] [Coxiellaceae bacterium]